MIIDPVQETGHAGVHSRNSSPAATFTIANNSVRVRVSIDSCYQTTTGIPLAGILAGFRSSAQLRWYYVIVHFSTVGIGNSVELNVQLVPTAVFCKQTLGNYESRKKKSTLTDGLVLMLRIAPPNCRIRQLIGVLILDRISGRQAQRQGKLREGHGVLQLDQRDIVEERSLGVVLVHDDLLHLHVDHRIVADRLLIAVVVAGEIPLAQPNLIPVKSKLSSQSS